MSRHFSTAARVLLDFIWQGMTKDPVWENSAKTAFQANSKLPTIKTVKVKGKPHKSSDPKEHVSMVLYDKNDNRITSVHVYKDGSGKYSKAKFN